MWLFSFLIIIKRKIAFQKHMIAGPTKVLIHRLSEVGHLYSRVEAFVRDREAKPGVGMIEQSLCHHLQAQLTEYYRLVAVLESQMSGPPHSGGEGNIRGGEETGLTLKRLDVWINEWRLRMRMMSVCVEGARGNCCSSPLLIKFQPSLDRCTGRCTRKSYSWLH